METATAPFVFQAESTVNPVLAYPARLMPNDDGTITLTLPDVPEVNLVGKDEDDVFGRATVALEGALALYIVESRSIPSPSDICGAPTVCTEGYSLLGMD